MDDDAVDDDEGETLLQRRDPWKVSGLAGWAGCCTSDLADLTGILDRPHLVLFLSSATLHTPCQHHFLMEINLIELTCTSTCHVESLGDLAAGRSTAAMPQPRHLRPHDQVIDHRGLDIRFTDLHASNLVSNMRNERASIPT